MQKNNFTLNPIGWVATHVSIKLNNQLSGSRLDTTNQKTNKKSGISLDNLNQKKEKN
ncbi:MAG: hypothetical protein NTW22_07580 [Proteobacteria bacterium]|nr:hypothetical protein [Pseudomonadota bacterium]